MTTVERRTETLPASISDHDRAILEAAGVQFGNLDSDPLFIVVSLPEYWWIRGFENTASARTLVDVKGRMRALIRYTFGKTGYKSATIELCTRYGYGEDMQHPLVRNAVRVNITGEHKVQHSTKAYTFDNRFAAEYFAALKAANDEARAWLDQHYPKWEDPSQYWD